MCCRSICTGEALSGSEKKWHPEEMASYGIHMLEYLGSSDSYGNDSDLQPALVQENT